MTQKELLYVEDAIQHEKAIIEICQDMINNISDDNLLSFVEEQIECHQSAKEKLIKVLRENANE